jgi:carbonic anhydrase
MKESRAGTRHAVSLVAPLDPGLHDLDPTFFGTPAELLADVRSDVRDVLFLACADHATGPDHVSFVPFDRLFVVQNLGATVPTTGSQGGDGTLASLQFAIHALDVRHLIVCGHVDCRIVGRRALSVPVGMASHDSRATRLVRENDPEVTQAERVGVFLREHVLVQLEHLVSHEFVRRRLAAGALRLHGWLVDDATANVHAFDPRSGVFERLGGPAAKD